MRLTSSFAVFRLGPGEKRLAKARWFAREDRPAEAEQEYRDALRADPDLRAGWLELFELLRRHRRFADALDLARGAGAHFGPDAAMPLAIEGAALAELGRTREAVASLESAIERDGNLALAWHELAYAAFRAGEYSRALLVLDRAFTLEPHTDTLVLRGRILREAGQFDAAEVAFEGAAQSAEHDIPRREAEREIAATRRAAALGKRRPRDFTARERAFAELGALLLDGGAGTMDGADDATVADLLAGCLGAFSRLAATVGWPISACCPVLEEDRDLAAAIAREVGASVLSTGAVDAGDRPLVVTVRAGGPEWEKQILRLERWKSGLSFALTQPQLADTSADVVGTLRCSGPAADVYRRAARALRTTPPAVAGDAEIAALARQPLAHWRVRQGAPSAF